MIVIRTEVTGEREREKEDVPSSGVMVSSKLSRSSGLGKFVFIVEGRSSSVKSVSRGERESRG